MIEDCGVWMFMAEMDRVKTDSTHPRIKCYDVKCEMMEAWRHAVVQIPPYVEFRTRCFEILLSIWYCICCS